MTRRRIAFFSPYPHVYGGGEHGIALLACGLQDRGWDVDVVVPAGGPTAERMGAAGLDVHVVAAPPELERFGGTTNPARAALALPGYWRKLARSFRGNDVVQAYAQRGALLAGPAAKLARVPFVWNLVGFEPSTGAATFSAGVSSVIVTLSHALERSLPGVARRRRTVVVPYGMDLDPGIVGEAGADPLVATVARLTPEKGVDVLVQAMASVRARHQSVRLVVIGPKQEGYDDYAADLLTSVADLGLTDAITFTGAVPDPSEHWKQAWVYVQPSRNEGFGLAVAEAMAAGLPVIASDTGGLAEVVERDRSGLLVPPEDPGALADAIDRLLVDRGLAARLGAAARERVFSTFTLERMVDRYEAVYAELS